MHSGIGGRDGGGDPRPTDWPDPTQAADYPPTADPAYAEPYPATYPDQYPAPGYYGSGYPTGHSAGYGQTGQLPAHWQPGSGYPGAPPPPPSPPPHKPGRWLWIGAGAAIAVIAGLVLALVVMSSSTRESTVVAPPPEAGAPETMPIPLPIPLPMPTELPTEVPTRVPGPTATREPLPTVPGPPETTNPGVTESVVYTVTGEGRAINITYVDSGGVMQTEFNVALPWSKEVSLAAPAKKSASVAILNVGRDVTCSVSVDGAQVRQRTGRGLTICSGAV